MKARGAPPAQSPLAHLRNIGPKTAARLAKIGIRTEAELRKIGPVGAYIALKARRPREISLNALWAIHAALTGGDWRDLPAELKALLKAEVAAQRARWPRRLPPA